MTTLRKRKDKPQSGENKNANNSGKRLNFKKHEVML